MVVGLVVGVFCIAGLPSDGFAESYGAYGNGVVMGENIINATTCKVELDIINEFKNKLICTNPFRHKDINQNLEFIKGFLSGKNYSNFLATEENCKILKNNMQRFIEEFDGIIKHENFLCKK